MSTPVSRAFCALLFMLASVFAASAAGKRPGVAQVAGPVALGERVLAEAALKSADTTVLVSPLNAGRAMVTLAQGASGATQAEFQRAFRVKGRASLRRLARSMQALKTDLAADKDVTTSLAGSLWLDRAVRPAPLLRNGAPGLRGIEFFRENFADAGATGRINSWVDRNTRGMIPEIVDDLPANTALVIADALYFKGKWLATFDPAKTRPASFRVPKGDPVMVPMMEQQGRLAYDDTNGVQAVALAFMGDRFEARFVLPPADAVAPADAAALASWLSLQRTRPLAPTRGTLRLPRLDLAWSGDLMDALSAAGLQRAMSPRASYAGFTRTRIAVSKVSHKVVFKADETGAEGAAATAVVATRSMDMDEPFTMVLDRPFWLFVQDKRTGAVLFEGRVSDPGTRAGS